MILTLKCGEKRIAKGLLVCTEKNLTLSVYLIRYVSTGSVILLLLLFRKRDIDASAKAKPDSAFQCSGCGNTTHRRDVFEPFPLKGDIACNLFLSRLDELRCAFFRTREQCRPQRARFCGVGCSDILQYSTGENLLKTSSGSKSTKTCAKENLIEVLSAIFLSQLGAFFNEIFRETKRTQFPFNLIIDGAFDDTGSAHRTQAGSDTGRCSSTSSQGSTLESSTGKTASDGGNCGAKTLGKKIYRRDSERTKTRSQLTAKTLALCLLEYPCDFLLVLLCLCAEETAQVILYTPNVLGDSIVCTERIGDSPNALGNAGSELQRDIGNLTEDGLVFRFLHFDRGGSAC